MKLVTRSRVCSLVVCAIAATSGVPRAHPAETGQTAPATNAVASAGEPAGPAAKQVRATRSFLPPPKIDYRNPQRDYVRVQAGNWTIQVERELGDRYPERQKQVVQRLEVNLARTLELLPAHAAGCLRKLTVFVMLGPEAANGGRDNGSEYFRRTDPDYHGHLDLRWRSALVIYSAKNYLQLDEHWAVQCLLHEFAHAWHLEQWPEKEPPILEAWEKAEAAGLYRGVKDVNGTVLESAYARQNQLEYFAELSCAYFWRGEYEPFDRAALQQYDPAGFALIEKMWGVNKPPPARSPRAGMVE